MKIVIEVHNNKFRRLLDTVVSKADHIDVYQVIITTSDNDIAFDFKDEDECGVFPTVTLKEA